MLKKLKKHRHFPHLFWSVIIALVILLVFFFGNSARSGLEIIDTHEHIESMAKAEELLLAMDERGISQTILVPSPIETITLNGNQTFTHYWPNVEEILAISEAYPNRFIPFCTLNPADEKALKLFEKCHEMGGKGLKLYNGHSFYYETFGMALDAPEMDPIYAYAEENRLPILYHVNINNYGDELENILGRYPDLTVSIPHFMVSSRNLDKLRSFFDRHPNVYTDLSFGHEPFMAAGFRRISNDIEKYRAFIEEYANRFLFGADMVLTEIERKEQTYMETSLQCYRDILEKRRFKCDPVNNYYKTEADKNVEAAKNCRPVDGKYCKSRKEKKESFTRWYEETRTINGLNLSSDVLRKIYVENAERFLGNDLN